MQTLAYRISCEIIKTAKADQYETLLLRKICNIEIDTFAVKGNLCEVYRPFPINRSKSKTTAEVLFSVMSLISCSMGYIDPGDSQNTRCEIECSSR